MFKLIGALGVISSCGFLGFSFASKIEKRLYFYDVYTYTVFIIYEYLYNIVYLYKIWF